MSNLFLFNSQIYLTTEKNQLRFGGKDKSKQSSLIFIHVTYFTKTLYCTVFERILQGMGIVAQYIKLLNGEISTLKILSNFEEMGYYFYASHPSEHLVNFFLLSMIIFLFFFVVHVLINIV